MKKPASRRQLDSAIHRMYGENEQYMHARTVMANTIVAQLMPEGAVKGGSAIKLRFGDEATRFTTDLDVARASTLDEFIGALSEALAAGWDMFTGDVVPKEPATPKDVPEAYVMQPFDIKLRYNDQPWCTVPLEVGHNEIGDADNPDWGLPEGVKTMFLELGFPEPSSVPLMRLDHQVAQKLHALTGQGSKRAHDLIDLQVIVSGAELDLPQVRRTCERLFAYRAQQAWPPVIVASEAWGTLYAEQLSTLNALPTVEEATTWANDLIARIAGA